MKEAKYQAYLVKLLQERYPDSIILKNDPNYKQGIPDLVIFEKDSWAMLEVKKSATASHQPNQDYYVKKADAMSFGAFIYPENEEEVLDAMDKSLRLGRKAFISVA